MSDVTHFCPLVPPISRAVAPPPDIGIQLMIFLISLHSDLTWVSSPSAGSGPGAPPSPWPGPCLPPPPCSSSSPPWPGPCSPHRCTDASPAPGASPSRYQLQQSDVRCLWPPWPQPQLTHLWRLLRPRGARGPDSPDRALSRPLCGAAPAPSLRRRCVLPSASWELGRHSHTRSWVVWSRRRGRRMSTAPSLNHFIHLLCNCSLLSEFKSSIYKEAEADLSALFCLLFFLYCSILGR